MKKQFKILIMTLIVSLTFTLFMAHTVSASETRSYYISKYDINVNISKDGSALVEEIITYKFSGHFNGVTMDIDFSGSKGINESTVFVKQNGELIKANYTSTTEGKMLKFKVFEASDSGEKTFIYRYKLKDVVTRYNDIAEFNRKLIGGGWDVKLQNVHINIILPEGASKEELKIFAHGPLTGESSILDSKTIEMKVELVPQETFVEARVLFPIKLVSESSNVVDKNALEDIIKQESDFAETANKQRDKARKDEKNKDNMKIVGNVASGILILPWLALFGWLYVKFDKELKSGFKEKYYRELPGEYTPAEMSVLMNFGKIQARDIMATILDLVRKKQLEISHTSVSSKIMFWSREKEDYVISLKEKPVAVNLKSHEKYLIDWFINKIGNGQGLLLGDIKKYVKDRENALYFKECFDHWKNEVVMESDKNNFFNNSLGKGKGLGVLASVVFIILGILSITLLKASGGILLIFLGIILFVYAASIKKRSAYGNEQYKMWLAFKKFLKDFSNMEKAVVQSIVIWEHYLVYAVSLGVAKEVIDQLPKVFKDNDLDDPNLTIFNTMRYGNSYLYFNSLNRMFDDTMHTVEKAVISSESIAQSQNSSSSGSGGGFSGGDSGGGGGNSGGGAF